MKRYDSSRMWFLSVLAFICVCAATADLHAETTTEGYQIALPELNPGLAPSDEANRPLLYDRLVISFGRDYAEHHLQNLDRSLCEGMAVYFLQRELQALIDMWRGTGSISYLDIAARLTRQAIEEATTNRRSLIWHSEPRGDWPCFYLDTVLAQTGGHSQLCDFQGSAGFLAVARALHQVNYSGWREIADFVERDIVEKWLYYKPSVTEAHLLGPRSSEYLLAILNSARDVREHFACICLDLDAMGYKRFPYRDWASLLIDLYLTGRYDSNEPAPRRDEAGGRIPTDWGLFVHTAPEGYTWLSVPSYDPNRADEALDTSHANRTAWLATRACHEGFMDKSVVFDLINTMRFRIWAPEKGPFYFNNYVDGSDGELDGLGPGRGGNIWFGWHRLAAFDKDLEDLFLSIAYDLTNGGDSLPANAQNRIMPEAPLCLQAWAVRLLSEKGQPLRFP